MGKRSSTVLRVLERILLLSPFLFSKVSATSVAIVKSPDRIIMAADSKGEWEIAGQSGTYQHCKIHIVGNFAFANAGLVRNTEGFDSVEMVRQILSSQSDFKASAEYIAETIKGPLLIALRSAKRTLPPGRYDHFVTVEALTVGIVGMQNGVPSSAIVTFTKKDDKDGNPVEVNPIFDYCPSTDCPANLPNYRVYGYKEAFNREARSVVSGMDLLADARRIIELEINDAPDAVGEPIIILEIDASGLHWEQPCGGNSLATLSKKLSTWLYIALMLIGIGGAARVYRARRNRHGRSIKAKSRNRSH